GAMAFAQACAAANLRPITGVELTLSRGLLSLPEAFFSPAGSELPTPLPPSRTREGEELKANSPGGTPGTQPAPAASGQSSSAASSSVPLTGGQGHPLASSEKRSRFLPPPAGGWAPVHLTLLVESEQGYSNLCRLITLAHRETRRNPRQPEPP